MSTGTRAYPTPPPIVPEFSLTAPQWGMVSFLTSEVAFFCTLIVVYVAFMGQDTTGPTPAEALSMGLVIGTTICLLSSSVVIHAAQRALERGKQNAFCLLLSVTIALGIAFLAGTAIEWHELIYEKHLTIGRNLFGTTYYTLVGFHALHVTGGVTAMLIVLFLALRRDVTQTNGAAVQLVAWYWHFVDAVWVVVFLVVYVAGKSGTL